MCRGSHGFIPVAGVVKIQLIYTYNGQSIENVFNVISGGSLLLADLDRIEGVFASWWTATGRAQVPNNISLVKIVADALGGSAGLHKEYTSGFTGAGLLGATQLPGSCTTSVKLATGTRGRSFRGRIYWPGLIGADLNNGLLTTTRRDAIQAAVNTLRTSLTADGSNDQLAVVSYCVGGVWRGAGVATPVTSASAHLLVDSQRRRLIGRGL
jgi:hypothetical protein